LTPFQTTRSQTESNRLCAEQYERGADAKGVVPKARTQRLVRQEWGARAGQTGLGKGPYLHTGPPSLNAQAILLSGPGVLTRDENPFKAREAEAGTVEEDKHRPGLARGERKKLPVRLPA
jgi:hypothetical protein